MRFARTGSLIFLFTLSLSLPTHANERPQVSIGSGVIHGGNIQFAKAGTDTINLMAATNDPTNTSGDGPCHGAEPYYDGDFDEGWNGWTSLDITQPMVSHWNVSQFNQSGGNHAAWCGGDIPSCGGTDPEGGYGNAWHDLLQFTVAVGNATVSSLVTVTADLQHDSEPGYDYTYLSAKLAGQLGYVDAGVWDGANHGNDVFPGAPISVTGNFTYLPSEYIAGNMIAVYFRFYSDGAWSDEDCMFQSHGACQVDNIRVTVVNDGNSTHYDEDFEHGGDPNNFGLWTVAFPAGVGDFAELYTFLEDADPCATNFTQQVAFIDDGVVVPGTGGSQCVNWCYGPSGYIVTTTGGLAGETEHIHNAIESPVMAWPQPKDCSTHDDEGIILTFSVYRHEDLSADAPGIFYTWGVRSADTDGSAGDPQVITDQGWSDRNFVYYGGPDYIRAGDDVTDLMNPGRDEVQIQLTVYELGYAWYWTGNDGYPAPYFDNVTVKVFPYHGPGISAREIDLAQDNFPERGTIDYGDLGSHHVRFDIAKNISPPSNLLNVPGDSLIVNIVPVRAGADLSLDPRLVYHVNRNTVFDSYRGALPASGWVSGHPGLTVEPGDPRWYFDLPDTGFLFPGDVLHYFIEATDAIGGAGGSDPQTALLPADTTGFSTGFGDPMGYNSTFTVHALPSIIDDGFDGFEQPRVLFINDFGSRGGENKWYISLSHLGFLKGDDYDVYHVNGPSSGVGNGIGGRANDLLLANYTDILYTCGDLSVNTISNGDFYNDAGDDVGTLTDWLDQGGKDIFLTGDDLASDLAQAGTATLTFLEDYMGVTVASSNIRPFIGNQTSPRIRPIPGNPVFHYTDPLQSWIAYGGCPAINRFDGVHLFSSGQRLAEFEDPLGWGYHYSACTLNILNQGPDQSRVISLPYDFMFVVTDPHAAPYFLPARAQLLDSVFNYFNLEHIICFPSGTDDLQGITLSASHHPNPFNPVTTITYSVPQAGHLRLSIYNVRGQLIKTLSDGDHPAGADQTMVWDGTNNLGSAAASGVYFYEVRTEREVLVGKMTLLK